MCCCINASGHSLPPVYIFPRVNFKSYMLNGAPNGSFGLASKSGWMNNQLFPKALGHFIKHMNVSKNNPGVLVMDNHESQVSIEVVEMARKNGLHIVTFPPHCSHRMQPLDVTVYGPFKTFYNNACSSWMLTNPGIPLTIYELAAISCTAYERAFSIANITSGFKATGIYPLNKDMFSKDVFMPSDVTDRENPHEQDVDLQTDDDSSQTASCSSGEQSHSFPVSPEQIRPYPKAPQRKDNRPTKKGVSKKSRVITSTPEKRKAIAEKLDKEERKAASAKKKIKISCVENSEETDDETDIESESESEESSVDSNVSEDEAFTSPDRKPTAGDYVVVEFVGKRKVHYVGAVIKEEDGEGDLELRFLRMSRKARNCFVDPVVEDVKYVEGQTDNHDSSTSSRPRV